MGRRLEVLWRLRTPDRVPADHRRRRARPAAAARARARPTIEPVRVAPGDVLDADDAAAHAGRASATGARSWSSTAARSRGAARSSTSSRPPPTRPIRIDLWGDEVDRLTEFTRQRPAQHRRPRPRCCIFPARELLPDRRGARPRRRAGRRPSRGAASSGSGWPRARCSTAWRAGCRGWSTTTCCITDVLPDTAKVVLVEPRRMRDRANDLLAEEDDLARALASTWARDADRTFPRLHAEHRPAAGRPASTCGRSARRRETPDSPMVQRQRLGTGGRRRRGAGQPAAASCWSTSTASSSPPTARARHSGSAACCCDRGLDFTHRSAPTPT